MIYTQEDLKNMKPNFDSFVGIDSDGCVYDTMGVKQRDFFHPLIVTFWGLELIEKEVREVAEFVNLYSKWRGSNRFKALLKTFELLHQYPGLSDSKVKLPPLEALKKYCNSGLALGNPTLKNELEKRADRDLERVYEWSCAVTAAIDEGMDSITPFEMVRENIERIHKSSDIVVLSQTPEDALVKDWEEHNLAQYVNLIAGQELGSKVEHLRLATDGRYAKERVLLIGDAPGDMNAAGEVGVSFYPICPGREVESWTRFYEEAYPKFQEGSYKGNYENELIKGYQQLLSDVPPWVN